MKKIFTLLFLMAFSYGYAAVTLEQKLVVVANSGVNGGLIRVAVMVKGTSLTAFNTVGSTTIDIQFDNTKVSFPANGPLSVAATHWPVGITSAAYGRSATYNTTLVRVLLTGGNVNINFDGTPAGYDILPTYDSLVTLNFTILDNSVSTNFTIATGSNQIGLFNSHNDDNFTGVINDQPLTVPLNLVATPLPVELVSFTASARGRNIDLSWATKTELNNYGFDVERKAVASDQSTVNSWSKVGFVEGKGTTNAPQSYKYSDVVKSAGTFTYRLKQTDRDGKFTYSPQVEAKSALTTDDYKMSQNYPNPFNPSTKFNFAVSTPQQVSVKVFNIVGQEVQTLFNGIAPADQIQEVTFDGARLASGIYFYVLRAQDRVEVKKMLMMK
jgi:Secretion system C-terminal sorting domain